MISNKKYIRASISVSLLSAFCLIQNVSAAELLSTSSQTIIQEENTTPLIIQVLGTPASGKSKILANLQDHFDPKIQKAIKTLRNVDLDLIREAFNKMDSKTKFYIVVKAMNLFSRASTHPEFDWIKWEADKLIEIFNNEIGKECSLAYNERDGLVDKTNNKPISAEDFIAKTQCNLDDIFAKFDNFKLGNIINRYDVLTAVMESMLMQEGLRLDDAGAYPTEILRRLKTLRNNRFLILSILVHPKTVLVNLLLSSLRGIQGAHYAPAALIVNKYSAIQNSLDEYKEHSEKGDVIESKADYDALKKLTEEITASDNEQPGNKGKNMDAIIIDHTQTLENAIDIVKSACSDKEGKLDEEKYKDTFSLWRASLAQLLRKHADGEFDNSTYPDGTIIDKKGEREIITKLLEEIKKLEQNKSAELSHEINFDNDIERVERLKTQNKYINEVLGKENLKTMFDKLKQSL